MLLLLDVQATLADLAEAVGDLDCHALRVARDRLMALDEANEQAEIDLRVARQTGRDQWSPLVTVP